MWKLRRYLCSRKACMKPRQTITSVAISERFFSLYEWLFQLCNLCKHRSVYRVSFPVCGEKYDCCSCYNPLCYHGNLSWFSFCRLPSPCIRRPYVVPMKTLQIGKECQPQSCKSLTIILFTGASCTLKKNKLHILLGVYMWVMGVRVITSG